MAYERYWEEVSPRSLSTDGTSDGSIGLTDLNGFYVKQDVVLQSNTRPATTFQIKRIDVTNSRIWLGSKSEPINKYSDLSAFLIADASTIQSSRQPKNSVPKDDQAQGTYETEPIVARRVILVDDQGNKISSENPLPVDASVSVVVPPVTVDLDALTPPTQANPDNVLIVGSEDGTKGGLKHAARVDSDLDLRVGISDGENKAVVDIAGNLQVSDGTAQDLLQEISGKLAGPIPVEGTINADMEAFSVTPDNVMTVGSIDGTKTGAKYGWVNNIKQQILAAHDRDQEIIYADFGTKNQRITQINYISPTFPGVTARKIIAYSLVGNQYRRDNITWSIV